MEKPCSEAAPAPLADRGSHPCRRASPAKSKSSGQASLQLLAVRGDPSAKRMSLAFAGILLSPPPAATSLRSSALRSRDTRTVRWALPFVSSSAESTSACSYTQARPRPSAPGMTRSNTSRSRNNRPSIAARSSSCPHPSAPIRRSHGPHRRRYRRGRAPPHSPGPGDRSCCATSRIGCEARSRPSSREHILDVLRAAPRSRACETSRTWMIEIGVEHILERGAEGGDREVGSSEMKPTVSERIARRRRAAADKARMVGSSVANSMSLATHRGAR